MNRHTKLAIFLAPFLLIGGYIAADYYANYEIQQQLVQKQMIQLSVLDSCDLNNDKCVLKNNEVTLSLAKHNNTLQISSTKAAEKIVISFEGVSNVEKENVYHLTNTDLSKKIWQINGNVNNLSSSNKTQLRLVAVIDNTYYFAEFISG